MKIALITLPYVLIMLVIGCRNNCHLDNFTPWHLHAIPEFIGTITQQANEAELSRASRRRSER